MQSQVVKAIQTTVPKFETLKHGMVDVQSTQAHQGQQLDKLVALASTLLENQGQLDQRLEKLENLLTIRTCLNHRCRQLPRCF